MKEDNDNIWDKGKYKKSPFKVPKDYFENFESNFFDENIEKKQSGFTVPEGYFETFEVSGENPKSGKLVRLNSYRKYVIISLTAAASLLLFFGIKNMDSSAEDIQWADLNDTEISNWFESDPSALDSYDIAEVYHDVDLENSYVTDEELNDYLNDIDVEQLILEN